MRVRRHLPVGRVAARNSNELVASSLAVSSKLGRPRSPRVSTWTQEAVRHDARGARPGNKWPGSPLVGADPAGGHRAHSIAARCPVSAHPRSCWDHGRNAPTPSDRSRTGTERDGANNPARLSGPESRGQIGFRAVAYFGGPARANREATRFSDTEEFPMFRRSCLATTLRNRYMSWRIE